MQVNYPIFAIFWRVKKLFWGAGALLLLANLFLTACSQPATPTAIPSPSPTLLQGTITTAPGRTPGSPVANSTSASNATPGLNSSVATNVSPSSIAALSPTPINLSTTIVELYGEKISFAEYVQFFKMSVFLEVYQLRRTAAIQPAPGQEQEEARLLALIQNAPNLPVDRQTLENMLSTLVLLYYAKTEFGITAAPDETERELNNRFGPVQQFTGTEINATVTAQVVQITAAAIEIATVSNLTPLPPGGTPAPPSIVTATPTKPASTATSAPTRAGTPLPTFTPIPTPTFIPSPLATAAALRNIFFSELTRLTGVTQDEFKRYQIEPAVIERKLDAKFRDQLPKIGETRLQFRASHILVSDEKNAQELLSQLRAAAPADVNALFVKLAREKSLDLTSAERNGDLGWAVAESYTENFSQAALALSVGQLSNPLQTAFGWHIIYLTGKEDRSVDALTYYYLTGGNSGRSLPFARWFSQKTEAANIKILL